MAKKSFQGQEIHAVFIAVSGECVPEGMGSKPAAHTKFRTFIQYDLLKPLFIHRTADGELLCKKPGDRFPVLREAKVIGKNHLPD